MWKCLVMMAYICMLWKKELYSEKPPNQVSSISFIAHASYEEKELNTN